jgi:hypothetical protein
MDGRTVRARRHGARHRAANPMTKDEVIGKARDLIAPVSGAGTFQQLAETIFALEGVKNVKASQSVEILSTQRDCSARPRPSPILARRSESPASPASPGATQSHKEPRVEHRTRHGGMTCHTARPGAFGIDPESTPDCCSLPTQSSWPAASSLLSQRIPVPGCRALLVRSALP